MLNIITRISLSKKSKIIIRKYLRKNNGRLSGNSWKSISKSVKNEISGKLLYNQSYKCAYCERYLFGQAPQIDHFVHKASYPQFAFETTNLFYACTYCNSSLVKGQKQTVRTINIRYDLTSFNIVHPYRNNPDNEILYTDEDRVYIDLPNCTYLGKRTIVFFDYAGLMMSTIRSRTIIYERLNPLLLDAQKKLIQDSITYK